MLPGSNMQHDYNHRSPIETTRMTITEKNWAERNLLTFSKFISIAAQPSSSLLSMFCQINHLTGSSLAFQAFGIQSSTSAKRTSGFSSAFATVSQVRTEW
jgi:hypothetical protein